MYSIKAFGAASTTAPIPPMPINRRTLTPSDVKVEIVYCGICHSDLHYARNEWADVMPTARGTAPRARRSTRVRVRRRDRAWWKQ